MNISAVNVTTCAEEVTVPFLQGIVTLDDVSKEGILHLRSISIIPLKKSRLLRVIDFFTQNKVEFH